MCPGLGGVIGVQVENLSVGLVLRKVGEHANHGGRADTRGNENGGTIRILQDEFAGGESSLDGIADFDVLPQVAGYFALCFYGNTVLTGVAADDGVLAKLAGAIGKLDADGGVLTWLWLGEVSFEYILGDAIGEDILFEYLCLAEHITWFNVIGGVQGLFMCNQNFRHNPVHGGPGCCDVFSDRFTENFCYGREQVVMDNLVLVFSDAKGYVLVGDAVEQLYWIWRYGVDLNGCKGDQGCGQGFLLFARVLVASVAGVTQQLWMRGKHHAVEGVRNGLNIFADCRKCGFDGLFVCGGESLCLGVGLRRDEHETP